MNHPIQIINNITISSASATYLARAVKDIFGQTWIEKILFPFIQTLLLAITAGLTFYSSWSASKAAKSAENISKEANKLTHQNFVNQVLLKFIDINTKLPMEENARLTKNHKQLLCNYFDSVCWLIENYQMTNKEAELIADTMKERQFTIFLREQRKEQGNLYWNWYWKWYQKNK